MAYTPTIGLEIHAELNTQTKMFSRSLNNPDETQPNQNIHPIDLAHPGTLPTINKQALEHMVKIGLALGGTVANYTEFDRKHYFYPDIPKGYQISQYEHPIVSGGELRGVAITRVHLEEDTGNSKHVNGVTLVDYNRAGVPLMELVTEPVIHSASEAAAFARELQILLRYLNVAEANMEKGEMRVEANISVSDTPGKLGTKVEVKNLNSFRSVERAIDFEVQRMTNLLNAGRGSEIVQETRGWDEVAQVTVVQRRKENANDYRYFPDPDLPKLYLHELFDLDALREALPELPEERRVRYRALGIKDEDVESFIADTQLASFFEAVAEKLPPAMLPKAVNYITSDLLGLLEKENASLPDTRAFVELMEMYLAEELNSRATKDILKVLATRGGNPRDIATNEGLLQESDPEKLTAIVRSLLEQHPQAVAEYRSGKEASLKFLMGQVMRETKGSANPHIVEKVIKELLSE